MVPANLDRPIFHAGFRRFGGAAHRAHAGNIDAFQLLKSKFAFTEMNPIFRSIILNNIIDLDVRLPLGFPFF